MIKFMSMRRIIVRIYVVIYRKNRKKPLNKLIKTLYYESVFQEKGDGLWPVPNAGRLYHHYT